VNAFLFITLTLGFIAEPVTFSVDPGEVQFSSFYGEEAVFIPGGASPFGAGDPSLPGRGYSMVIPQGTELEAVRVEIISRVEIPGVHRIAPVTPVPLSEEIPSVIPHSSSYLNATFPDCPVQAIQNGSKTGFRIASFCFVPLTWNPLDGKLYLITDAVLTPVLREETGSSRLTLTENQISIAAGALGSVVGNPEMLAEYSPSAISGSRGAPWVVISDEVNQETLQPLVDFRASTHGSEFVSTQWIYENYPGRDTQEQIRNYLKDAYENMGLVYALIVGDFGETTRISGLNIGGNIMDSVTDLYYSDLDGSWDGDGDDIFGELNDGIDYYSDIYVGRFSSDVPSRLATMVSKTIAYETEAPPGDWQTTALLAGAGLWVDDPPGYWGSFVCDSIGTRIPDSWTVHELYEVYSSHPDNQIELYNQGVSYSSLNGHGNPGGVYWYFSPYTEMVTTGNYYEMANTGMPVVFHSMACHPGHLEDTACIAERLMFWPQGGAIAVMFNSHYGWGTPPSFGPSEWLELYFAQVLIQEEQYELGVAHAVSKDEYKAEVTITLQKWVLQENNFLGDPAVRFVAGQMGTGEEESGSSVNSPMISPPSPNPACGACTIFYSVPGPCNARVNVYDLAGRSVAQIHNGPLGEADGSLAFDASGLATGCYTVVLSSETGMATSRMLVVH